MERRDWLILLLSVGDARALDPIRVQKGMFLLSKEGGLKDAEARGVAGRPSALVLETVPGKGVPSFEVYEKVHYIRAEPQVWERALEELGR